MPETVHCSDCGDAFDSSYSGVYCYSCGWRCDDCSDCCCDSGDSRIHPYDYRPELFKPKGEYPNEPLLGVELEVGGNQCVIADVVDGVDGCENHLYLKEDGSISGAEIVTHPMTLAWARGYRFAELLRGLRQSGCYVNDSYGLHVHVSRNAFRRFGRQSSTLQLMWLLFIYRNVNEVERLARRTSEEWASFRKPSLQALIHKAKGVDRMDSRYVAVNCVNTRTYELRFFAATLDESEFFAAIEFADASVRYVRQLRANDVLRNGALTWDHFAEWVKCNDYPNLLSHLG